MPLSGSLSRIVFILLNIVFSVVYAQEKQNALEKKYPPDKLQEDARLFRDVTLAMHPAVGIYNPRDYYTRLFDNYIQSLNDSLTEKEFRIRTKLVAEELRCGHTEVIFSRNYYKAMSKKKLNYSPYVFIPVNDKVYVLANLNKKLDSTLKKGVEITKINGVGVDSMLRYGKRFISSDGFNRSAKNHYIQLGFNSYFPSLFGRPDTFTVEYRDGKTVKTLKYPAFQPKTLPPLPLGAKDDSLFTRYKRARIKYRYLDSTKKTMLVKIERFSRKRTDKAYRKIFRKLRKNNTENLVIDLRNNGGGSLENSYRLLSYLIDSAETQTLRTGIKNYPYKKYTHGNILFKMTRFAFTIIGKKEIRNDTNFYIYTIHPRKKNHYNKKVFVLINGGSFSASCLVSAYLKGRNRTTFIGEETGGTMEGCNAGITPYYKMPNTKISIRVPAFRIVHDISPAITGHGIMPDYPIEYTMKDILAKRDLELLKVKELIK